MKRIVIVAIMALMAGMNAWGQGEKSGKKLESNISFGAGMFMECGNQANSVLPSASLSLSYGLDVRLNEKWSVMPAIGIGYMHEKIGKSNPDGANYHRLEQLGLSCEARYHFNPAGKGLVLGLGPVFSYILLPNRHYLDASPASPLNNQDVFRKMDIGLKPSILYQVGNHWQFGLEAGIGLMNTLKQYPEYGYTGTIYLHQVKLVAGVRF